MGRASPPQHVAEQPLPVTRAAEAVQAVRGALRDRATASSVAGGIAGIGSTLATIPLDVIKTRLQVQDGAGPVQYRTFFDAVRSIVRTEGARALYAGLGTTVVSNGLANAIYFGCYSRARQRYQRMQSASGRSATAETRLGPAAQLAAGVEAGVIVQALLNPLWVVKTRLYLQNRRGAAGRVEPYRNMVHALGSIAREEGLRGLYRGFWPSLLLVSHGALQFFAYEEISHALAKTKVLRPREERGKATVVNQGRPKLTPWEVSTAATTSKIIAGVATYPLQVMRSRLQQRVEVVASADVRAAAEQRQSAWYADLRSAVRTTWRREGVRGFYRGVLPHVAKSIPQAVVTWVLFEAVHGKLVELSREGQQS
ncbi:unnamed protein product [Pedinophyceae sp. YPF-701]|nr:unnamed protein product [Pedinophyceae sp. YPF-701]